MQSQAIMTAAQKRRRWRRQDWIHHALLQLKRQGPPGVTLEALCHAAGRTRGSLYHHFHDHNALLDAVVEHWQVEFTDNVIAQTRATGKSGHAAAADLNRLASALDFEIETAIRRLTQGHPNLHKGIAEADKKRIRFLTRLRVEAGEPAKEAKLVSEIEYAAFVGAQQLPHIISRQRLKTLYTHLSKLAN